MLFVPLRKCARFSGKKSLRSDAPVGRDKPCPYNLATRRVHFNALFVNALQILRITFAIVK
jgi:hypothetical protein